MAALTFAQRLGLLTGRTQVASTSRGLVLRERKAGSPNAVMQAIVETGTVTARWTQMDYTAMSREGYGRNPYVYASIRQNAISFAGIKWRLYTDSTKKKELTDHPLLTLWNRPNPRQGGARFREMFLAYLLIDGNSFIQALSPTGGPPLELQCLRPDRTSIIAGNAMNPIAGYKYTVGNSSVRLPAEVVFHTKLFNPLDDWRGLSPMAAAAQSIDQSNAAKAWNVALLQNGARTTGVITTQYTLEDDQYRRLKEDISDEYSGYLNAGRPIILEGGATWQEAGMTPMEMSWLEGQKLDAREIAIIYNIAPELIGDSTNKTYSNFGEARRALYEENILPTCDLIREEINPWLCAMYPDNPYLDYDPNDIEALQDDQDATEGRATRRFNAGYMTVNEARKSTGLDEDTKSEWGDKYIFELPMRSPAASPEPELPTKPEPGKLPGVGNPLGLPPPTIEETNPKNVPPNGEPGTAEKGGEGATKRILPFCSVVRQGANGVPEAKAIVATPDAFVQGVEKRRNAAVEKSRHVIAAQYRVDQKTLAAAIRHGGGLSGVHGAVKHVYSSPKTHDGWKDVYSSIMVGTALDFAEDQQAQLQELGGDFTPTPKSQLKSDIEKFVTAYIAWRIGDMLDATSEMVWLALEATMQKGGSDITLTDLVNDSLATLFALLLAGGVDALAETETITAANAGMDLGAIATGIQLDKTWFAVMDERTRPWHADMDGTVVGMNEAFDVDGEQMMYPTDTSLGATGRNIYHCRCVSGYAPTTGTSFALWRLLREMQSYAGVPQRSRHD